MFSLLSYIIQDHLLRGGSVRASSFLPASDSPSPPGGSAVILSGSSGFTSPPEVGRPWLAGNKKLPHAITAVSGLTSHSPESLGLSLTAPPTVGILPYGLVIEKMPDRLAY